MRIRWVTRRSLVRLLVLAIFLIGTAVASYFYMIRMPSSSYAGPLLPLTSPQQKLARELERSVEHLAGPAIGERNLETPRKLDDAAAWLTQELTDMGYGVNRQQFLVGNQAAVNLEAVRPGVAPSDGIIVIGAHYDSVSQCPGANDNGSGVAAALALAHRFASTSLRRTLRFVFFTNEEPPNFQTDTMGSLVYARACRDQKNNIVAMFSLETIGCYSDAPGSQQYPSIFNWLYPTTGNFIAFVGDLQSRSLVREAISSFRESAKFPSEGAAIPGWMTGVGWSDHWSFWQMGYKAIMITDTAPFRYPDYHRATDTPDKLDYERMARVVDGLGKVIAHMANPDASAIQ